jgi:hypothetical protein
MIAYVLGVIGIFRFTRSLLEDEDNDRTQRWARSGAWLAALVYGANPNLIYLQTTAMTESLYLALFIWAVVYFAEFLRSLRCSTPELTDSSASGRPLYRCAACLAGAELTRYDGWFLAAVIGSVVSFLLLHRLSDRTFRRAALKFLAGIAAAPLLWLAYNAAVYGNPLEFANGQYSAKAIEQRTAQPGYPAHPGGGNVVTAASFFLKSAQLNMAQGNWANPDRDRGGFFLAMKIPAQRAVLLLWVPVVFYGSLDCAWRSAAVPAPVVAICMVQPALRLQLLPLFAVSAALTVRRCGIKPLKGYRRRPVRHR